MEQTLELAQTFPDGTEVSLYDAEGWAAFPSSGGPPGSPLQTKTVEGGSATFDELETNHPYFVAAKLDDAWRHLSFIHDAENPPDWYGSGVSKAELATERTAREAAHGAQAALMASSGKGYVEHGADPDVARPVGLASVEWKGSVEPTNMTAADTWLKTP
jgi:hypothetical protein